MIYLCILRVEENTEYSPLIFTKSVVKPTTVTRVDPVLRSESFHLTFF